MKLRPYQNSACDSVWDYFKSKTGNPVIAMPTGTGKSVVISGFLMSVFCKYPRQKILVLTHVKELIEQNHSKLITMWPNAPVGIYSAGLGQRDVYSNIIFGGIGSVNGRAREFGHVDLIIIDEAHLLSPKSSTMYRQFIAACTKKNPFLKVIGLTATPYRLGQGLITNEGGLFTDICFDNTQRGDFNKLIDDGYIVPLVPKRTSLLLNVDKVHVRGGEFVAKELSAAVDKYEITYQAVKEVIEQGENRHSWLIFSTDVEHAIHITEMLIELGVSAACVHSGNKTYKMGTAERDDNIQAFKDGRLRALVNNNILTTGFDHPGLDMIVALRPIMSPGLWVQMLGRGTRPLYEEGFDLSEKEGRLLSISSSRKQDCLVLDFANNTERLGPINDPYIPKQKGKAKGGTAPVKCCDHCNTWNHATVKFCVTCGEEFHFKVKIEQRSGNKELIKRDNPVVETFKVDHITYSIHQKKGAPPIMKVSYYCNLRLFSEYVCIQHEGFALHKAHGWWKERTEDPFPISTEDAIAHNNLQKTLYLRVWTNKKYPEILSHCFSEEEFQSFVINSN